MQQPPPAASQGSNGGRMVDSGPVTDSFGDFVAAALPGLLRFGHVLTGDPREAEDLVQEALARSLRRWRSVRSGDAVPYVRRVMIDTHITRWRRQGARVRPARLPGRQRTVLGLRYTWICPTRRSPSCVARWQG